MTIGEFLKAHFLSVGDNVKFLLEKLDLYDENLLRKLEAQYGEPAKMSKSKANTVDPEEAIQRYGADTVRLYILFAGPVEKDFEWTEEGVAGAYRFLRRLWNYVVGNLDNINRPLTIDKSQLSKDAKELRRKTHQTLAKYQRDMEELSFNTAIASIMELFNHLQDFKPISENDWACVKETVEIILFMLYPITPHICEELWHLMGNKEIMAYHPFPDVDTQALQVEEVEIGVQINGKLRATIRVKPDASEEEAKSKALQEEKVRHYLNGKTIKKVIYVKGRLINLVV